MKNLLPILALIVSLALAACGGSTQAAPAPTSVPKNITGAAQPNSSTTLARGDYSRPLGSSGAQAPTEQQPAATASPTEAPKAEQPQALTETDITNIGTIIDWPLDESGQVGGVQLRFAKDMDLSAIPWIVEIHVKGATVKSVKANDVGTVWISPALRPALNKLVDEIESKKKSAAPAPAAPKAATGSTNSNTTAPKPAAPTYKGPRTITQILQYGGSVKDVLSANGVLAGVLLESADPNVFVRLRSAGVDCQGENPAVQSCWIGVSGRPLVDDRPKSVYPPVGPHGESGTAGPIGQGHLEALGRVVKLVDENGNLVDGSERAVAAVVEFTRSDQVSSYTWDWVEKITIDNHDVTAFNNGQRGTIWVQKDNRPFPATISQNKKNDDDKDGSKKKSSCPTTIDALKGFGSTIKVLKNGKNEDAGLQMHLSGANEAKLKECKITVQGSDGDIRSVWLK